MVNEYYINTTIRGTINKMVADLAIRNIEYS